jgi:hypothetical protein
MTDPIIEAMAKRMWFDEAVNVTGRKRLIAWDEEQPGQQDRWRERAKAAYLAALPMIAEEMVQWVYDGYICRTCAVKFIGAHDHPEPSCNYPCWDKLSESDQISAIRALAAAKVEELSRGQ